MCVEEVKRNPYSNNSNRNSIHNLNQNNNEDSLEGSGLYALNLSWPARTPTQLNGVIGRSF